MFPFVAYSRTEVVEHKKMPLAFIYTMNASEEVSHQIGYHGLHDHFEFNFEMMFTKPDYLYVYNTYQFKDYSKYVSDAFDETKKKEKFAKHNSRKIWKMHLNLEGVWLFEQNNPTDFRFIN